MGMNNNEEKRSVGAHNLILEETVVDYTGLGELTVRGSGLHINKIDVEAGELSLEGQIDFLSYADQPAARGGFFARMFR